MLLLISDITLQSNNFKNVPLINQFIAHIYFSNHKNYGQKLIKGSKYLIFIHSVYYIFIGLRCSEFSQYDVPLILVLVVGITSLKLFLACEIIRELIENRKNFWPHFIGTVKHYLFPMAH